MNLVTSVCAHVNTRLDLVIDIYLFMRSETASIVYVLNQISVLLHMLKIIHSLWHSNPSELMSFQVEHLITIKLKVCNQLN